MLGDIFSFVKTAAEKEGIRLLMKIDESVPECVFLDGDKLRQIILNYLTNAIKYSGGKTVNLYIKSSKNTLYISVKDEGQGIKKEDMENIFKPFIQIDKANEHTGTGLGLTITQKYAQSMGGDVSVESEYNRGSVFKAYVKYSSCHLDEIDKREILHNINGIKTQKLIKILIVDDKLDNRELLANILKNDGFEIFMAENGQEAVEEFKKYTPDIIWMDRKMPLLNGEEATKIIRTLPKGRDVVIIGITASAFKEDEERLLSAGMDEFILKPYDISEIFTVMKKYFDVEYIYEKSPETEDELPHEFSYEQFVTELKTLDDDTLKSLYHNTLLLDREVIQTSIKDIEKENKNLADMLNYLVEEMLYNVIIKNVSEIVET
jgi:CheY-like chemotaxis protein/anti-sigma regulatory factor (Ser/Thr protein kinase)